MRLNLVKHIALAFLAMIATPALSAQITDAAGRTVELDLPAKRVIVGEARQIHVIAALRVEKTFDTIVGWRDDLLTRTRTVTRRMWALPADRKAAAFRLCAAG